MIVQTIRILWIIVCVAWMWHLLLQLATVYAEIFAVWNFRWTGSKQDFRGSQVHRGKVACYVLLQISNCCKLANFHGLNFRCISRWPRNLRNLHTAEISAHTVYITTTASMTKHQAQNLAYVKLKSYLNDWQVNYKISLPLNFRAIQ